MEPLDFMDPEPPIEIQIEMSKHNHKFELLTWEPDGCEEGTGVIIGVAKCKCGEQIGPTEIERRINGFAAMEGRPSPEMLRVVLKDRELAEDKLEAMERAGHSMDCDLRKDSVSIPVCSCGWTKRLEALAVTRDEQT